MPPAKRSLGASLPNGRQIMLVRQLGYKLHHVGVDGGNIQLGDLALRWDEIIIAPPVRVALQTIGLRTLHVAGLARVKRQPLGGTIKLYSVDTLL